MKDFERRLVQLERAISARPGSDDNAAECITIAELLARRKIEQDAWDRLLAGHVDAALVRAFETLRADETRPGWGLGRRLLRALGREEQLLARLSQLRGRIVTAGEIETEAQALAG